MVASERVVSEPTSPSPVDENGEEVNPNLNRLVAAQLTRTKMCALYQRGTCVDINCRFAHSRVELRSQPDLRKTAMCRAFAKGDCSASHCRFAHGEQELRSTTDVYKTQLCNFWERGNCKKGDSCRHAHGQKELRPFEATQRKVPDTTVEDENVSKREAKKERHHKKATKADEKAQMIHLDGGVNKTEKAKSEFIRSLEEAAEHSSSQTSSPICTPSPQSSRDQLGMSTPPSTIPKLASASAGSRKLGSSSPGFKENVVSTRLKPSPEEDDAALIQIMMQYQAASLDRPSFALPGGIDPAKIPKYPIATDGSCFGLPVPPPAPGFDRPPISVEMEVKTAPWCISRETKPVPSSPTIAMNSTAPAGTATRTPTPPIASNSSRVLGHFPVLSELQQFEEAQQAQQTLRIQQQLQKAQQVEQAMKVFRGSRLTSQQPLNVPDDSSALATMKLQEPMKVKLGDSSNDHCADKYSGAPLRNPFMPDSTFSAGALGLDQILPGSPHLAYPTTPEAAVPGAGGEIIKDNFLVNIQLQLAKAEQYSRAAAIAQQEAAKLYTLRKQQAHFQSVADVLSGLPDATKPQELQSMMALTEATQRSQNWVI